MTTIHSLPLRFDGAAGGRLTEQLAILFEAGVDLGPRRHHIEMIRASIQTTLRALPGAFAEAVRPLAVDDVYRREAEAAIERFMEAVQELTRTTEQPTALLLPSADLRQND